MNYAVCTNHSRDQFNIKMQNILIYIKQKPSTDKPLSDTYLKPPGQLGTPLRVERPPELLPEESVSVSLPAKLP